uniref:Cyclic phosphodiesterase n=1 Tax=Mantoniella antarctica TaxID=81844 RepID=A0A6U3KAG2_9CHLO|mmetsp:Transcript_2691/g.4273  ORF Transcript_2691/g.4273 Transcript_2691/m.4273 type:complete len:203 (+) Transcript_2691:141-749(+)
MAATAVYSIWLEPPTGSSTAVKSAAFIRSRVSPAVAGTGPALPVFAPHVTLAGGFEGTEEDVRAKTLQLAADLGAEAGPLFWGAECAVDDVAVGEAYFQCVYLRMQPSPQLAKAHEMAAAAFGVPVGNGPGVPYMPHLSLMYGDQHSAEDKAAAAVAARETFALDRPEASGGFTAHRLSLWCTDTADRSCSSWARVDYYPLQ